MFSFEIGNTTVHLLPLIIVLFIAFLVCIIRSVLLSCKNKRIIMSCRNGEYNKSITLATKQLRYYQRVLKFLKNKNIKAMIDVLYLQVAISNFAISNDDLFMQNISCVSDNNSEKHFWFALFYLLKNDLTKFQDHFDLLSSKQVMPDCLSYLCSLKKLKEGIDTNARNMLSSLYPKLNYKILIDISQKIMEQ